MVIDLKGKEIKVGQIVEEKCDGKKRLIEVTGIEECKMVPMLSQIRGIDKRQKYQTSSVAMFCTVINQKGESR